MPIMMPLLLNCQKFAGLLFLLRALLFNIFGINLLVFYFHSLTNLCANFFLIHQKIFSPKFVRKKIAHRRLLWRNLKANPCDRNLVRYKKFCKHVRNIIRTFYANRENSVVDDGSRSSFYNYVNKQLHVKSSFFRLMDNSGLIVTDHKTVCDLFNNYFASVHIPDDGNIPTFSGVSINSTMCSSISFDPADICQLSKRLKSSCSLGVDGIPAIVYKKTG